MIKSWSHLECVISKAILLKCNSFLGAKSDASPKHNVSCGKRFMTGNGDKHRPWTDSRREQGEEDLIKLANDFQCRFADHWDRGTAERG